MEHKHIVSFSGGKDSTAMLLHMIELKMPIDKIIFADTTLEFPEMYEWINKVEEIIKMSITKVMPHHSFNFWFYGKPTRGKNIDKIRGFPFVTRPCWWQRDAKEVPLRKVQGKGNIIYLGIAKDEEKRADAKRYKKGENKFKFPLIEWEWSEQDCLDYLEKIGLKHPLLKFKRTGCWLCPKQNLQSLRILMIDYPELWKKLKQYEKDSPQGFKPNFRLIDFEKRIQEENSQTKLNSEVRNSSQP